MVHPLTFLIVVCLSTATGNVKFAECFYVCRVYSLGHSANKFFASAALKTLGKKKHSVNRRFAECKKKHSANSLFAECFFLTLSKEIKSFSGKEGEEKNIIKKTLSSAQI